MVTYLYYKMGHFYYKMGRILQIGYLFLLQNV